MTPQPASYALEFGGLHEVTNLERLAVLNEDGPVVHPNGFLQLDLSGNRDLRLHIFHNAIPRQTQRTSIHDHIFDMRSTVLLGNLTDLSYEVVADPDGPYEVHQARAIQCEETNLFPIGQRVRLDEADRRHVKRGEVYELPAFTFHDSRPDPDGFVVTVMRKTKQRVGTAKVLVPHGVEPDNEFSRLEHDTKLLWMITDVALKEARFANR